MKHHKSTFVRFIFSLTICLTTIIPMNAYSAGTYPVQVNTLLIPPYSLSLSDYSSGLTEKLAITLLNRDLMQPQLKVKLRLTIKCASDLTLRTKPDVWFEPIVLDAGIPTRLTLEEVLPYFLLKNLDVQGYMKGDALPEGLIEFQVEVFEYSSGVSISMNTVSVAHLSLPKPPKLIQPENGKIIPLVDPTNLLFQWAPQYFGNTGAINYEFILKELPANILSIEDAFLSAPTVYQSTHESTSFLYSASEPALQVGKKYAWAVRSILNQDTDPNIRLDNNGYSTINSFDVSELNLPPTGINATVTPEGEIDLKWTPRMNHTKFVVTFSRDDQEPKVWHDIQTTEPNTKIGNIAPGYAYVFRVGAYCASIAEPTYSNYSTVKVSQSQETVNPDCGKKPTIEITNRNPIEKLDVDDKIMVGDFPVRLTQVTGGAGSFSGTGVTYIPYLNSNLSVTFSNIGVNTDKCLISGMVSVDIDKNENGLVNLDALDQGGTGGKVVAGVTKVDKVLDFTMPEKLTMQYTPETGTMEFFDGSTSVGSVDIPKNKAAESDFPFTVEDKDGNVYEIQENPEKSSNNDAVPYVAVKLGNQEGPILDGSMSFTSLAQNEGVVTFNNDDTSQYAIDQTQDYYQSVMIIKDKYQLLDGKYKVKWKYIPPGKTEQIIAKLDNKNNIDPKKVKFKTRVGKVYESAYNSENNTYTITLVGGQDADGQELFAIYPSTIPGIWSNLGKLNIISYTPIERSLVLVKTLENDDTEAGKVEDELNQIYNPVGVNWTVSSEQFTYNVDGLFEGGSGILSTYLPNMRTLNAAFRADKASKGLSLDSKAAYLFLVKQAAGGDRDKQGFMPRGMQLGYINTEAFSSSPRGAVIAHELGHGVFRLYHTFNANYGDIAVGLKGSTDNLMDYYKGGTDLAKWQWDMIYDPAIINGVFDGDKEAAIVLGTNEYLGFSPNGDVIDIRKLKHKINSFDPRNTNYVYAMSVDGKTNTYKWDSNEKGYKFQNDSVEKPYLETVAQDIKVAIWLHQTDSCYALYKFIPVDKGYIPQTFKTLETQRINNADYSKGWIIHEANKLDAKCKQKAEAAITAMNAVDCKQSYVIDNPGSVALWVNSHTNCLSLLTNANRLSMLQTLIQYLGGEMQVGGEFDKDDAILRLLNSITTTEQRKEVYDYLKNTKLSDNSSLYETIFTKMDEGALVVFSKLLTEYIFENKVHTAEKTDKDATLPNFIYKKSNAISSGEGSLFTYKDVTFNLYVERIDGKIKIQPERTIYKDGIALTAYQETEQLKPVTVDPDAMIVVHFYSDLKYGLETKYSKGETLVIPALALWAMIQEKSERDLSLGLKAVGMIITLPAAFEGGWAAAFAAVDQLALGSDILVEDAGWKNQVTSATGKTLLTTYQTFINCYFAGRALEAVGAFNKLKSSYADWKAAKVVGTEVEEISVVEKNIGGLISKSENVAESGTKALLGTKIDNSILVIAKNENLPNWIKISFKDSKYVTCQTTNKVTLYRDFGDQAFMDGSFSTTINNATRDELALHPSFSNNMRFKSTIEVPAGETLNIGKVGPYPPGSMDALPGGADQILLPENYSQTWIKQILDTETGEVYTVSQFKELFPKLIKNL